MQGKKIIQQKMKKKILRERERERESLFCIGKICIEWKRSSGKFIIRWWE